MNRLLLTQGVRVALTDGAAHAVDSSEMAFKLACQYAFRRAACLPRSHEPAFLLLSPLSLVRVLSPNLTPRLQLHLVGIIAGLHITQHDSVSHEVCKITCGKLLPTCWNRGVASSAGWKHLPLLSAAPAEVHSAPGREAFLRAAPVILEPVMAVEVRGAHRVPGLHHWRPEPAQGPHPQLRVRGRGGRHAGAGEQGGLKHGALHHICRAQLLTALLQLPLVISGLEVFMLT